MKNIQTATTIFHRLLICFWLVSALVCVHAHAQAEPQIVAVDYLYLSSNAEQVTFRLNGPYMPKDFTLKGEKPRIVFDFLDTGLGAGIKTTMPIDGPIIDRIRIGLHGGAAPKTRVVLDLSSGNVEINKEFDDQQNSLVVTVSYPMEVESPAAAQEMASDVAPAAPAVEKQEEPVPGPQEEPPAPPAMEAPQEATAPSLPQVPTDSKIIESISFDSKPDKGELVLFKLNGFHPPIVYGVEQGMPRVVCDFKNTETLKDVKTIKDLSAKYVRSIRVGKHTNPDKVRVVIDLQSQKNYDIEQVFFKEDNLFVIIINEVIPAQ